MTTTLEARPRAAWQVLDLGLESFARTLARQEELVQQRLAGRVPDTLVLEVRRLNRNVNSSR